MTSWHVQPVTTAFLMHLPPLAPGVRSLCESPPSHSICPYPLCGAAGRHVLACVRSLAPRGVQLRTNDAPVPPQPQLQPSREPPGLAPSGASTSEERLRDTNPPLLTSTEEPEKSGAKTQLRCSEAVALMQIASVVVVLLSSVRPEAPKRSPRTLGEVSEELGWR